MIESVVVVVVVAGAVAFVGRKYLPTRRAKGRPADPEVGCSCPGCPTAGQGSCPTDRTAALVLVGLLFAPAAGAADGSTRWDFGGVAVGWNFPAAANLEVVSQVYADLPSRATERVTGGLTIGLIATLGSLAE